MEELVKEGDFCPACGKKQGKDALFCKFCGRKLSETNVEKEEDPAEEKYVFCRVCGNELIEGGNFCSICGTPVNRLEAKKTEEKEEQDSENKEKVSDESETGETAGGSETEPGKEENRIFLKSKTEKKILPPLILSVFILCAFFAFFKNNGIGNLEEPAFGEKGSEENAREKEEKETEDQEVSNLRLLADSEAAKNIARINSGRNQDFFIDAEAPSYTPGPRDFSAGWNNTLFYTLEDVNADSFLDGKINGYDITRKLLKNRETGNQMEYEIYTNPDTGIVNKIVSIEYKESGLEIIDYYYDDAGKINFMFIRNDVNYVPSYATPSKDGYRYYFNNDSMVKWRFVEQGEILNYVIGKQAAKENNLGNILLYRDMEPDLQFVYDGIEKRMINWAYNTYHVVLSSESFSEITGYVYNEAGEPFQTAVITLYDEEGAIYQTSARDNGLYSILVPSEEKEYRLVISEENSLPVTVYGIKVNEQTLSEYQDSVYLAKKERRNQLSQVQIYLYDAMNYAEDGTGMAPLGNAEIHIRDV